MSTVKESKELVVFKSQKLDLSKDVSKDIKDVIADFKGDKSLKSYKPFANDLEPLSKAYCELIKKELTPELAKEARALRLKIRKVRCANTNAVDADKSKYQSVIKLLISVDKKVVAVAGYMESNLDAIENYEKIIEKDRLLALENERKAIISEYRLVLPNEVFSLMDSKDFDILVKGLEAAKKEAEKQAEKERKEKAKADKINAKRDERKREVLPFLSVMTPEQKTIDLATLKVAEYKTMLAELKVKQTEQIDNARKYAEIVAQKQQSVQSSIDNASKSDKELIALWFTGFGIPDVLPEIQNNPVVKSIISKFEMFTKAAKADINRMK